LQQLAQRAKVVEARFDAIDALDYHRAFTDAATRAKDFLRSLPAK
jgi:hypothetical protein